MRQGISGGARRGWLTGAALIAAAAMPLGAQGTGNGYLFGEPTGGLGIRAGWFVASASSQFYRDAIRDLNVDKSDFSAPTLGADFALRLSPRIDVTFDGSFTSLTRSSHYRNFVDNNNQEIEQSTSLKRVPLTVNLKAYLSDRGRSVGRLAYIPSKVVPWIGLGAGAAWYNLQQSGDFINPTTSAVFNDHLETSGWGPAAQGMGGVDVTLTPRIALTGDARYLWSRAEMTDSYQGYDKIDLSGVSIALGVTFRL
jgi:hypothetical protein